jgi:hypothetical protein
MVLDVSSMLVTNLFTLHESVKAFIHIQVTINA